MLQIRAFGAAYNIDDATVRRGCRQSIPSRNIDNCADVRSILPASACGQKNRPLESRFARGHRPSSVSHKIFTRSPRRPRKMNTSPPSGFSSSAVRTFAARTGKPLRKLVTPAAIHTRVPVGRPITIARSSAPYAAFRRQLHDRP